MNYLSLFNGMGCFEIALIESGLPIDIMYTSEIDKFCLQQTRLNFPNNIELGDVRNIDVSKLEKIDFVAGGSPCQSFSFAGKRKGISTVDNVEISTLEKYLELKKQGFEFEGQSYLFWEYMRILTDVRKYNPDVIFLLENVEMGNKWERVLSEAIGVFGVHINSDLVSAQNRKRIYWTNIRVKKVGLFSELHSDIPQPKDENIYLKDILEHDVDEKYYLSDKMLNYYNSNSEKQKENKNGFSFNPACDFNTKSKAVTTKEGGRMDDNYICVAMRGRNPYNPSDRRAGSPTEQRLEPNLSGKTNCLTSVQKDNLVVVGGFKNGVFKEGISSDFSQGARVYDTENKSTALTSQGGGLGAKTGLYFENYRIRRLTPSECAKLQTIPKWYKWIVSDTQQYKMLGNGWTVEVIKHILSFLKR